MDITSLISNRINTIFSEAENTTQAILRYIEEVRNRADLIITTQPPPAFPDQPASVPDLPSLHEVENIREIPPVFYASEQENSEISIVKYINEIESLLKDISIDKPTITNERFKVENFPPPFIPDELPQAGPLSLTQIPLLTVPQFEDIDKPSVFSLPDSLKFMDEVSFVETKTLFAQIDSLLNDDLHYQFYLYSLMKEYRNSVDSLVSLYNSILSILNSPVRQRNRLASEKTNQIIGDGIHKYFDPVYSIYMSSAPPELKGKLDRLYSQSKVLLDERVIEKVESENIFTSEDRKDEVKSMILKLKSELDRYEAMFFESLSSIWSVAQSYVLLHLNKMLIELRQSYEKESILISLRESLLNAVRVYYSLHDEALSYYELILNKTNTLLSYIDSILQSNDQKWRLYSEQIDFFRSVVEKYRSDVEAFETKVSDTEARLSLFKSKASVNRAKLDTFTRMIQFVNRLYDLRKQKVQEILSKAQMEVGGERLKTQLSIEKTSLLKDIHDLNISLAELDSDRFREEFNKWLDRRLSEYRFAVRLNTERSRLLQEAYNTFIRKALRHTAYLRASQNMINNFSERLSMIAFSPLASLSNGLHSSIDAVSNGLYELIIEG